MGSDLTAQTSCRGGPRASQGEERALGCVGRLVPSLPLASSHPRFLRVSRCPLVPCFMLSKAEILKMLTGPPTRRPTPALTSSPPAAPRRTSGSCAPAPGPVWNAHPALFVQMSPPPSAPLNPPLERCHLPCALFFSMVFITVLHALYFTYYLPYPTPKRLFRGGKVFISFISV